LLQRSGIESPLLFTSSPLMNGMIRFAVNPPQTTGSERTVILELGNIINSYAPGKYYVSITTRDAGNNVIDGPIVSAPFILKDNSDDITATHDKQDQKAAIDKMTVGDGSNTMTKDSGSRRNNIADPSIAPNEDKLIKDTMASSATTETTTASNNKTIVDGLREGNNGISKDLILGPQPVDKDSVRKIEEVALPCKQGEIATIGGYEVISNTSERPENNAIKVFVLCVKL